MLFLLDKHGLKEFATTVVAVPSDPIQFHEYRRGNTKAKRMILEKWVDSGEGAARRSRS